MRKREIDFLHSHIAPVMRAQPQIDPAAVIFELDVTRLSVTRMNRNDKRFIVLREKCIDAIKELPMTLVMVKKHEELIVEASQPTFWHEASEEQLDEVVEKLGPLMRQRQPDTTPIIILDLQDTVGVKSWLEIDGRPIKKSEYREQVEAFITSIVERNDSFAKVRDGMPLGDEDYDAIMQELEKNELKISLENLRDAWGARRASLDDFLRNILKDEEIPDWGDKVR